MIFIVLLVIGGPASAAFSASGNIAAIPAFNDIYVDSHVYIMDAYNINGYTYYKLRALAHSTDVRVWHDIATDTVYINTSEPYDQNYAADASPASNKNDPRVALPTKSRIVIDGSPARIESYLIDNYNYFKLRDFAENTNISVQYDETAKTIYLGTSAAPSNSPRDRMNQLLNSAELWNEVTFTQAESLFYSGNSNMVFVYYSHDEPDSRELIELYRESAEEANVKVYAMDKSSPENSLDSDGFLGNRFSSGSEEALPTIYVVNDSEVEIFDSVVTPSVIDEFFWYLSDESPTPSDKPEPTFTPTVTRTPSPSYTPTATKTPLPTPTNTATPSFTPTSVPTATFSPTPSAVITPKPTAALSPKPTAAYTPKPTPISAHTPSPRPTATPKPTATNKPVLSRSLTSTASQYINDVINLINAERSKEKLSPLAPDPKLMEAAIYKCQDISNTGIFSHKSSTYGEAYVLMDLFNIDYAAWGENIAAGQLTPRDVVSAWMNSPGHKKNILKPEYEYIGVGYLEDKAFGTIWAQEFIKKP
jgi:uncharacterized protein YkwD